MNTKFALSFLLAVAMGGSSLSFALTLPSSAVAPPTPVALRIFAPTDVLAGVRTRIEIGLVDAQGLPIAAPWDTDILLSIAGGGVYLDAESLNSIQVKHVRMQKMAARATVNFLYAGTAGAHVTLMAATFAGQVTPAVAEMSVRPRGVSGSLDTTFGGGDVFYSFGTPPYDSIHPLARLAPDGSLYVVSSDQNPSQIPNLAIRRFLQDLSMDTGFGAGGIVHPIAAGDLWPLDFQIASDGKLVLSMWSQASVTDAIYVLRLLPSGSSDPTFGSGNGSPVAIVFQPNGRPAWGDIAIGSDHSIEVMHADSFGVDMVAKLTPTGTLDANFGVSGLVTPNFGPVWNTGAKGHAIAVQPDGRVLIASQRLIRLETNGAIDQSFGLHGITPDANHYDLSASSIIVQSNGSISVAGADSRPGPTGLPNTDRRVVRYLADGSKDTLFGNAGVADFHLVEAVAENYWGSQRLFLRTNGKLVLTTDTFHLDYAVGTQSYGHLSPTLLQWDPNGIPDSSFGHAGQAALTPSNGGMYSTAQLGLRNDGTAVVASEHLLLSSPFSTRLALTRIKVDGNRDGAVNGDGVVNFALPGSAFAAGTAVAPSSDGGVFAASWRSNVAGLGLSVFHFQSDGVLDSRFAEGGEVYISGANQPYLQHILAVDNLGRLIVLHTWYGGPMQAVLRRYLPDGAPDANFGSSGVVTVGFPGAVSACGVAVDPMRRLTALVGVAGQAVTFRLDESGQLDPTFGLGGFVTYNPLSGSSYYNPRSIVLDRLDRIVLGGQHTTPGAGNDRWMSRLLSTGALDNTFGSGGETFTNDDGWYNEWPAVSTRCDHHILVGGSIGFSALAVIGLLETGDRDLTFGINGMTISAPMQSSWVSSISCLPDGSAILGSPGFSVTKQTPSGALDLGFGTNGQLQVPVVGAEAYGPSVCSLANGTIIAATNCAGAFTLVRILP